VSGLIDLDHDPQPLLALEEGDLNGKIHPVDRLDRRLSKGRKERVHRPLGENKKPQARIGKKLQGEIEKEALRPDGKLPVALQEQLDLRRRHQRFGEPMEGLTSRGRCNAFVTCF